MEDRYLYRAKRKDDGEWVEGHLITDEQNKDKYFIGYVFGTDDDGTPHDFDVVSVDPSKICQCTEINDKNGKLIWENDICRRVLLPTKRIKTNFKIAYVPYKWCISAIDLDGSNITFLSDYINNQYEVEVIGNIFDNQELLEK